MPFDFFRIFKGCCFCGKKEHNLFNSKLTRVVHPATYSNDLITFSYYHPVCLKEVFSDPEKNIKNLDKALKIQDQLNIDRQKEDAKLRQAREKIERARSYHQITGGSLTQLDRQDNPAPEHGLGYDYSSTTITYSSPKSKSRKTKKSPDTGESGTSRFDLLKKDQDHAS